MTWWDPGNWLEVFSGKTSKQDEAASPKFLRYIGKWMKWMWRGNTDGLKPWKSFTSSASSNLTWYSDVFMVGSGLCNLKRKIRNWNRSVGGLAINQLTIMLLLGLLALLAGLGKRCFADDEFYLFDQYLSISVYFHHPYPPFIHTNPFYPPSFIFTHFIWFPHPLPGSPGRLYSIPVLSQGWSAFIRCKSG